MAEEAERVDEVMEEVNKTSAVYLPLAQAAARLYFTLQSMQSMHFLYHYDLNFFESVFHDTLNDIKTKSKSSGLKSDDYVGRLRLLFELLFRNLFVRCAMGLLYEDRLVLALQLGRIRYESEFDVQLGTLRNSRGLQSYFVLGGRDLDLLLQGELVGTWDEGHQASPQLGGGAELPARLNSRLAPEQVSLRRNP